jgi:hypothetical protein
MATQTHRRFVIGLLLVTLLAPASLLRPVSAEAMLIPVDPSVADGQPTLQRQDDLQKIQGVLEAKVIRQRLADLGFSADEITVKLNGLSDEQIHTVATQLDTLMVGGFHGADDILHLALTILVIVVIVVLILALI